MMSESNSYLHEEIFAMGEARFYQTYDVIVVGGGLAGVCAAIAVARLGCTVALIQDRPVLGGNSSSEIRVPIGGADHSFPNARETGIIEELRIEDRCRNHEKVECGKINSIWDMILWEWVHREANIALFLNTSARRAIMANANTIKGVLAKQLGTEKCYHLEGKIIIDASGDGTVAHDAGAEFRMGREARDEFNEDIAPPVADNYTLGSSLIFRSRDMGRPVPFVPPSWAYDYPSDDALPFRHHGRITSGFWWIEFGGMLNTISDNEEIRNELWKHLFGVWDHIKNHGDHGAENYALDWVGAVPGKRESRRFIGDYILTQSDLQSQRLFPDRVAYGGWPIDLHPPKGIYEPGKPADMYSLPGLYSIPFRCLYSKNISNLMFAGRNISVTHVALGSTRLMATCAVEGQAVGTAAYLCKKYGATPRDIYEHHVEELQQQLLKDDCYIIQLKNEDPKDIARKAKVTASSVESEKYKPENVVNGVARPEGGNSNIWVSNPAQPPPQYLELDFGKSERINAIYLTFDTNLNKLIEIGAVPECVKDYALYYHNGSSWVKLVDEKGNYHRRCKHTFEPVVTSKLRLVVEATNGASTARVYEIRCYEE